MSYDLTARGDDHYSAAVPRAQASRVLDPMPNISANGPCGFVLQRGDDVWMEIDLEHVSDEGDCIEGTGAGPSEEVNCISFHIPYAFVDNLDLCRQTALEIAEALGWQLYDDQLDELVLKRRPGRKPWWRFW